MIDILEIGILGILLIDLIMVVLLIIKFDGYEYNLNNSKELPSVSVLVAVRNEESVLNDCLDALALLNYPTDKIEFLFGDDGSSDRSVSIIQSYSQKDSRIKILPITRSENSLLGKANVLDQLTNNASGEILFITDADIQVHPTWIMGLLKSMGENVALVNGITAVKGEKTFERLQNLDWLYAIGMMKVIANIFKPATAIGNNMAINKVALQKIGGYASIPFSLTEDHALSSAFQQAGYHTIQNLNAESLVYTRAEETLNDLLQQRKRWMQGASKIPGFLVFLLGIHSFRFLGIIALIAISWQYSILFFMGLMISDFIFLQTIHKRIGVGYDYTYLPLFQVYFGLLSPLVILLHLLPLKIHWKGRKY